MNDDFSSPILNDRTASTDNERIGNITPLPPPAHLIRFFPIRETAAEALVARTRQTIREILRKECNRLLVVVGPCSIHDPASALEYASLLAEVRGRLAGDLEIVMHHVFRKTTHDPGLEGPDQ